MTYTLDAKNRITNPGKFEMEQRYVPYFWDAFLNGDGEDDDGVLIFDVQPEDIEQFPELKDRSQVKLLETENGFVIEVA